MDHVIDTYYTPKRKFSESSVSAPVHKKLKQTLQVFSPVKPMLAKACKTFDQCIKSCPNGFFAEVKYDGDRVQIHKKGDELRYFSRNLKPVKPEKVGDIPYSMRSRTSTPLFWTRRFS